MNLSLGDSIGVILAPKNEILKKIESIKASSFSAPPVRKVTRANPDPKVVSAVSNPKILLRRSKNFQDKASSSKGKPIPQRYISSLEDKFTLISKEEFIQKENPPKEEFSK